MAVATYAAASINFAVALLSLTLVSRVKHAPPESATTHHRAPQAPGATLVYLAIALSGLCALGAEVVWTRLLSLLLGGTVYTFSIILAVFLLGLWAGSSAGSFLARRTEHPRMALAACQIFLAAAIAWTAHALARSLPYWPIDPWLSLDPWFNFEIDLVRCMWAIFPATLLWGASFPLAAFRRNLRRQHRGFDCRSALFQPGFHSEFRNARISTDLDWSLCCGRTCSGGISPSCAALAPCACRSDGGRGHCACRGPGVDSLRRSVACHRVWTPHGADGPRL